MDNYWARVANLLTIAAVLFAAGEGTISADDRPKIDNRWVEESKRQAAESIERYSSILRNVDESSVIQTHDSRREGAKATGRPREIKVDCSSLDGCVSVKTVKYIDGRNPFINLQVRNRSYNFSLTQASEDGPYILRDYAEASPGEGEGGQYALSVVAYQDLNQLLDGINRRNGSSLSSLRWDDGKGLLYADVTAEGREPKLNRRRELWFSTSGPWHLIERVIHSAPSRAVRTDLKYEQSLDGVPLPSKMVDETSRSGAVVDRLETTIVLTRSPKSAADFTLTAYGLPEPVGLPNQRQSYRAYWFLGSSLIAGFVALLLYRLARRRSLQGPRA